MPLSKRGALSAFGALAVILVSATSPDAAPPAREKRQGRSNLDARSAPAVNEKRDQLAANPSAAVKAWERREPHHWAKVSGWLAAQNVAMVQV